MALSSALFSGISGLRTLGDAMQIIGDNIANVNTVGFKGSTFTFQDLLSQSVSTMSGTAQVGRGTGLGDIASDFNPGSIESSTSSTDLAIGGDGFFILKEGGTENTFYSRAGNFKFDKDGNLVNPEGYILQGWQLDENGEDMGSVTHIRLNSFTSPPEETDLIQTIINLDADGKDNCVAADPLDLYPLSGEWDGSASQPLAETAYEYQTTVQTYDSLGSTHDITLYFDKAESSESLWEFIVTCNPDDDKRTGFDVTPAPKGKGMLARGTLEFDNASGVTKKVTLDRLTGTDPGLTTSWTPQTVATDLTNGYFTVAPDFIAGSPMNVKLDFGAKYDGTAWVNDALTSTQFARASNTVFQASNGYGAGDLQSVNVDTEGVITGTYSNGQVVSLYRLALAKFQNNQGLFKEGGNMFRETSASGAAITSKPGTNGLGSISPNSLEQSNVDLAGEFVKMIITQRGFQANSKIITVTDQMLADLINLKR
jgi:flagellar hook protein FlgE